MNAPLWCSELAAAFWQKAGSPPPFPRDLRLPAQVFSFCAIELPSLSVSSIQGWFERVGLPIPLNEPDRPLRGCLVAWFGEGFAFLDSLDDLTERAFSFAHELAHFLRDYLRPREIAEQRLGKAALEVPDGRRAATPNERVDAVLRNVRLGPFTHTLERDGRGRPTTLAESEAEAAADRLAFELLAPADLLGEVSNSVELVHRLVREFGLPPALAERYAAILMPPQLPLDRALARLLIR